MQPRFATTLLLTLLTTGIVAVLARADIVPEPTRVAVEKASRIFRARAVSESSFVLARRAKSAPREIRTDWTIDVLESWKGPFDRGRPVTVRIRGGRVGDFSALIDGEPEIIRGGEYVFFLEPDSAQDVWRTSSVTWGCLPIVRSMVSMPRAGGPVKVTVARMRRDVGKFTEATGDVTEPPEVGR